MYWNHGSRDAGQDAEYILPATFISLTKNKKGCTNKKIKKISDRNQKDVSVRITGPQCKLTRKGVAGSYLLLRCLGSKYGASSSQSSICSALQYEHKPASHDLVP